jgi:hypothetical protein
MKIIITTKNIVTNEYKEINMDTHSELTFDEVDRLHKKFCKMNPISFVNFIWKNESNNSNSFIFGKPYIHSPSDYR